jgi:type IV secretory pathway TrbD component
MTEFKRVPVHRGLSRQQLLAGCDRELFFLLAMFCGLLLMSGAVRLYWRNVFLAVVLWLFGVPVLAKIAIYDAHFKGVVLRSTRYLQYFLPANGKIGQSKIRPIVHKRWD